MSIAAKPYCEKIQNDLYLSDSKDIYTSDFEFPISVFTIDRTEKIFMLAITDGYIKRYGIIDSEIEYSDGHYQLKLHCLYSKYPEFWLDDNEEITITIDKKTESFEYNDLEYMKAN